MNFPIGRYVVCIAMLTCLTQNGWATGEQARLALIVGNGAYQNIGALRNPTADARLIASTLEELGFDTTVSLDSDQADMKRQIADFGRRLRSADKDAVGFFYYAGHGVQANGRNYLLPVEARPTDTADLDLMGVEANWVLRQMESAGNRTNIIVLDACRNNPFVTANRSLSRGLAQIDAPTGSFISYATAPGKVALDGEDVNSPFTTALASAMTTPGLPVEQIFKRVRVDVIKATQGGQIPWDSSSLVDDFIMSPVEEPVEADSTNETQTLALADPVSPDEQALWDRVSTSRNADRISMFLQIYPESVLGEQARMLLMEALMGPSDDTADEQADLTPPANPENSNADNTQATRNTEDVSEDITVALLSDSERQLQELDMINNAQENADPDAYLAYLEAFPTGTFVDLARAEVENLLANTATDGPVSSKPAPLEAAPAEKPQALDSATSELRMTINSLLPDSAGITGQPQSISQLSKGSPLYPPFEGLAEDYWKDQDCSNCHAWDKSSLCTQGSFYVGAAEDTVTRIEHPYGGFFKSALRTWAATQCE